MSNELKTTLCAILINAAHRYPDRDAIVFPDHRLTYSGLLQQSRTIAKAMLASDIKPGDHVGVLATNRPEYLPILFACTLIGAVAVLLNARFRTQELQHTVRHCDLKWIVAGNIAAVPHIDRLREAFPDIDKLHSATTASISAAPLLECVVTLDANTGKSCQGWNELLTKASLVDEEALNIAIDNVDPFSTALIMFTSGTTSMPKGCALNHDSVFLTSAAMRDRLSVSTEDVMWDPLPMFHMASILPLLSLMHEGGTFLTDTTVDIDRAIAQIHDEQATFLYPAFPAIMADLLSHPEFRPEELGCVRLINNIAHAETLRANMSALPSATHISAYGMTELSGIASHTNPSDPAEERINNCGQPYPGVDVEIKNPESGVTCPLGQQGEICVRGFSIFQGYYKLPEENKKAFDAEGWFHTGDLGSLDAKGRIRFHGRLKDMLKVGGENVSPLEIEAWLSSHPDVVTAQVVGMPDTRLDEVVAAFVEVRKGAQLGEQDIIDFCAGQLASYKAPRIVRFISEWPMSATKIQKSELRKMLVEA